MNPASKLPNLELSKPTVFISDRSFCPNIVAATYYKPPHSPAMHGWFFRESKFIYSLLPVGVLINETQVGLQT